MIVCTLYNYKELWGLRAQWRLAASFIQPFKNHLLRPQPEKPRNIDDIDFDAHLLLKGDFFLTSRCYPPKRHESWNWVERNENLRLPEKNGFLSQDNEKTQEYY